MQTLIFSHFDADLAEIAHTACAATRSATRRDSAENFGFVPDTYLPSLYAEMKMRRKRFNEFAEIHPLIGREKERQLFAVE